MRDVTKDDIGKPIFTAEKHRIGTLSGIDGPTIYLSIAEDIHDELLSSMKISRTTGIKDGDGNVLAGAVRASIADVTDDEIHFWPTYAAETNHESAE